VSTPVKPKFENPNDIPVTDAIVAEHGLTAEEYLKVKQLIGRAPNFTELGLFSAAWNEHCSYKSSKRWLKTLPTTGPRVIHGPGENAGVVDLGDGLCAVFKMESHNHPSYIEPFQGAATGVGGILRDVFTMGARPVAIMNALRFGAPDHPKTRHLVAGVVAGIGGYGNCIGVPTIGGETNFHESYNGNCLVNAMTVGLARTDRIFTSAATGIGNPVVYVGSKTGRDGIHGATMASNVFGDGAEEKRPTVQVGDPFTEKLLLEACLELMAEDAILSIQDMGAAGLTSSSVEMAAKGGLGIELELDRVPVRETGMSAYELMLSESQERMLMILRPDREAVARAVFEKWGLDFAIIGKTTDTGRIVLRYQGRIDCDLPLGALADEAPLYDRPYVSPPPPPAIQPFAHKLTPGAALVALMGSPDLCSRRWIWEQYDHMVMADTIQRPGGDAGVVRIHGTTKGLGVTTDVTPRYVAADPYIGGMQAVAETYRNLSAVGAEPLAITDCLNFGNPQVPEVMGQIVGAIRGIGEACLALETPVVSGNVSLYNQTGDKAIQPTPAIGAIGLLPDIDRMATLAFKAEGEVILVLGDTKGHLGQSLYLREIVGQEAGPPPPVDLTAERRNGTFVRGLIAQGRVTAAHDCADGGLLVAVAEMALAGKIGAAIQTKPGGIDLHAYLFGEDQARYVITAKSQFVEAIQADAASAGVPAHILGRVGSGRLTVDGADPISLGQLRDAHEGWLPGFMTAPHHA
jgi:phosphoribosylformylglycinamidine synthase